MPESGKAILAVLNDLVETCKDGQGGFEEAAEALRDENLKTLFRAFADQRRHFAGELEQQGLRLGGEPEQAGRVSATLNRGWTNLKSALAGKGDRAILAEAERGEDAALANYQEAMDFPLPASLHRLIRTQYDSIAHVHLEIRELARSHSKAA
jgi:uncharacterized protein (TIGR02284 family)